MDYKKMYEELQQEFEQYKKESIKWSRYDILDHGLEGYRITERQAQEALEAMIKNHDANYGITWDHVEYYIEEFGTEI